MQFKVAFLFVVFGCAMLANGSPIVISQFAEKLNLDASVQSLFPAVDELDQKLAKVSQCYESELAGQNVDIFEREASIKSIVEKYYQAFPEKTITPESIRILISSINQIANSCLNSAELDTVRYGLTSLSDMSDTQIDAMNGHHFQNQSTKYQTSLGNVMLDATDSKCRKTGASIPSSFDWRPHNVVTPIKDQGVCGSCWTFATVATIESAYLLQKKTLEQNFSLSEQQILDCAQPNGCAGGFPMSSYTYVKAHGLTLTSNYPYRGNDNQCSDSRHGAVAKISDFCIRGNVRYNDKFNVENLTEQVIQDSLLNYGPLFIALEANSAWTRNYRGGIVTKGCTGNPNHAVLLVGYTPEAWIIKNSWGKSWGNAGYFEIARGGNVCSIKTEIAFPLL